MELQIKKWGVLRDSTIPLPGLTVITGYTATGKSTVGKLLLAMVKRARVVGIEGSSFGTLYRDTVFSHIFGNVDEGSGDVSIIDDLNGYSNVNRYDMRYNESFVDSFKCVDAFIVETPFVVSLSKMFQQVQNYESRDLSRIRIDYPYTMNDVYGKMITPRKIISEVQKDLALYIQDKASGRLEFELSGPVFIESSSSGDRKIDVRSTASGQLGLAVFAKLLENGWVANDTISIFDEPESHMHPHWQLIYADLLVRCVEELGATIVVTTHTPYMLQALKVFSDQRIKDKAAFCLAERKGDHAQITVDDSPDLDRILPLMTDPMERIQLLKVWDDES